MMRTNRTRRNFLTWTATAGSGLLLARWQPAAADRPPGPDTTDDHSDSPEVTATEDLMREHGVLRRCLLVYVEVSSRLRRDAASVPPAALAKTATLFRTFGEDYHERKLEEAHIFPTVERAGGAAAIYPKILVSQHRRGREITAFVLETAQSDRLTGRAEALAGALDGFVRMYQNHAAREDTIVFPAWKQTLSPAQYAEMGEQFEDIEHQQFGEDGFEDAAGQIADIEASLGLTDLGQFTAAPPPSDH